MKKSNLLDAEFKTMVTCMLNELKGRVDELKRKLQQHQKGHGNYKKEPVGNEEYTN